MGFTGLTTIIRLHTIIHLHTIPHPPTTTITVITHTGPITNGSGFPAIGSDTTVIGCGWKVIGNFTLTKKGTFFIAFLKPLLPPNSFLGGSFHLIDLE
jgi:hypothetical protein